MNEQARVGLAVAYRVLNAVEGHHMHLNAGRIELERKVRRRQQTRHRHGDAGERLRAGCAPDDDRAIPVPHAGAVTQQQILRGEKRLDTLRKSS